MRFDNQYKAIYALVLGGLVSYFVYSLYVGKLVYETSTTSQWEKQEHYRRGHSTYNRFYHK